MQQIMSVLALPPSESFRMRVIFDSRYGMCCFFLDSPELRALMTLPSARRPELGIFLMWIYFFIFLGSKNVSFLARKFSNWHLYCSFLVCVFSFWN